jgi:hypothetical protein
MKDEIAWDMKNIAYLLHVVKEIQGLADSGSPVQKYTREICLQMFVEGPSGALISIRTWMATAQAILPDNYPGKSGKMLYSYLPSGRQCIGHNSIRTPSLPYVYQGGDQGYPEPELGGGQH